MREFLCAIRRCLLVKRITLVPDQNPDTDPHLTSLGLSDKPEHYFPHSDEAVKFSREFFRHFYSSDGIQTVVRTDFKDRQSESKGTFNSRCIIVLLVHLKDKTDASITKKVGLVSISGESSQLATQIEQKLARSDLQGYEIKFVGSTRNVDKQFIRSNFMISKEKQMQPSKGFAKSKVINKSANESFDVKDADKTHAKHKQNSETKGRNESWSLMCRKTFDC